MNDEFSKTIQRTYLPITGMDLCHFGLSCEMFCHVRKIAIKCQPFWAYVNLGYHKRKKVCVRERVVSGG